MNRKRLSVLQSIYRRIPKIACIGKCVYSCGSIGCSKGEYDHLTKITGVKPKLVGDRCNYLKDDRCSVYEDRPSVCRLFGVVDAMPCPHGCKAEKVLTGIEARNIMDDISKFFNESPRSFVDNV